MRTVIAGVTAWVVLLFGFTLSWTTFVLVPERDWFSNMLAVTFWWAIYALPFTFPIALVAVWVGEVIARRTVSQTGRLFVRAVVWLPVAGVYPYIILCNNPEVWLQSIGCAFAGAVFAIVVYLLIAPDIHYDDITPTAA